MRRLDDRALALALALAALSPTAATAGELPAGLRACTTERDDARRLACFDRELAAPAQPSAAHEEPATAPLTAEERFGLSGKLAATRESKPPPVIRELKARVAGVSSLPRGEFVATLDNGQVWIEEPPAHHLELAPGNTVRLIPGALSSFFLEAPNHRSARVKRVR